MIQVRKFVTLIEEVHSEMGQRAEKPLRKIAIAAIFNNPYAGRYSEDLSELIEFNPPLGKMLAEKLLQVMGEPVESLGKGALIGMNGDAIHGNACLLGDFANPIRDAIGGGLAWIQSNTKRSGIGGMIDIPMAHKDALYVRGHYDTITVHLPDAPHPDEIAVIIAAANRGYLNPRLGGLQVADIKVRDGQR